MRQNRIFKHSVWDALCWAHYLADIRPYSSPCVPGSVLMGPSRVKWGAGRSMCYD